ncbi:MAG TPA: aldo/keto reductase [Actinocrinis sp.]|jgi:aryl-alcohol dehydrogenase-like predicted oxidoreductase
MATTQSLGTVSLGRSGPQVSAIGLGCMGMSEFYGPADRAQSLAALERAEQCGVNFLDTSDAYGVGANEELLADFLAGPRRSRFVLATKFGVQRDPETGRPLGVRGDAEYVRQAADACLRRLGTDYIDLFYLHLPDPRTPIEVTVGAMAELVQAGKVRHLGVSNLGAGQLRAAHAVHPIAAVQLEWSVFTRSVEEELVPTAAELGIGFVPYAPLGRGFLTGAYTSTAGLAPNDYRQAIPRFNDPGNAAHNAGLVEVVDKIAAAHEATPAQVALAWLIGRGARYGGLAVVPIPGTKRAERVAENAGAVRLSLTEAQIAQLDALGAQVRGEANPPMPRAVAQARN